MYAVIGIAVANVCEVIDVLIKTLTNTKDKVGKVDQIPLDLADAGGLKALTAPAHLPSQQVSIRFTAQSTKHEASETPISWT